MIKNALRGLRVIHDSDAARLVFEWPPNAEYLYVFRTPSDEEAVHMLRTPSDEEAVHMFRTLSEDFEIKTADIKKGKLLTVHEYMRRGGYALPSSPGRFTYHFYPYSGKITCVVKRVKITGWLRRKKLFGETAKNELMLSSDYDVPGGVLNYKKTDGKYFPTDMIYSFDEPITPVPMKRHIITAKNETLHFYIAEENSRALYDLNIEYK